MIYYKRDELRYIVRREDYSIITLLEIRNNDIDKSYEFYEHFYKKYNRKEKVNLLLFSQIEALLFEKENFYK